MNLQAKKKTRQLQSSGWKALDVCSLIPLIFYTKRMLLHPLVSRHHTNTAMRWSIEFCNHGGKGAFDRKQGHSGIGGVGWSDTSLNIQYPVLLFFVDFGILSTIQTIRQTTAQQISFKFAALPNWMAPTKFWRSGSKEPIHILFSLSIPPFTSPCVFVLLI